MNPQLPRLILIVITVAVSAGIVAAGNPLDLRDEARFRDTVEKKNAGNTLSIRVPESSDSVLIPRIYSSLRSVVWAETPDAAVIAHPETDHWIIRWKKRPEKAMTVELKFDGTAELTSELTPIQQSGDGTLDLHAAKADTFGEKLRYEPQTHKNTVGYWVNEGDYATWKIRVEQPGQFNVGILQGCGAQQGGSTAKLSVANEESVAAELVFKVEETGHFQNFIWRHLGQIKIDQPGSYTVTLAPESIAKNALMDVRQIQWVRIPK